VSTQPDLDKEIHKAKFEKQRKDAIEHYNKIQDTIQDANQKLLDNIKKNMKELEDLLVEITDDFVYGDLIYRYYHCSYKCYYIQVYTKKIVETLDKLKPNKNIKPNSQFERIYKEGVGRNFSHKDNANWDEITRPQLEAFFHAKYFLEMAIKFGKELTVAPQCLPSGWAGLLYYYNLR
jgi:predicted ribosome quality control (RQC) complex YloA/Tae2 family protein